MGACCSDNIATGSVVCPECGTTGRSVKVRTIKQWLATHLVPDVPDTPFHFCASRSCPVVYFSEGRSIRYTVQQLRYPVGIKEAVPSLPLCYCFGVTEEMIAEEVRKIGRSTYSSWITRETKQGNCACEVRNPSGKCCLKEVKKTEDLYTRKEEKK